MIVVPPEAVLLTTPVELLILATEVTLELQLPPEGVQVSVVDDDGHILVAPLMALGSGVTVTLAVVAL